LNDSSGKYIGFLYDKDNKLLINFTCICGREYDLSLNKLKASKGFCPLCRYERMSKKRSYTVEEVQEIFRKYNCEIDKHTYVNIQHNIKFTCSCGKLGNKKFNDFLKTPMCTECGRLLSVKTRSKKYSDILNFYELNNCKLLLEEEDYTNTKMKANFTCSCGRPGYKSIKLFYKNPFCKLCGLKQT